MPPLLIAGVIASSVAGAALTSRAAGKAAKGQEDAARQAQGFNRQVYGEQKQLLAPFVSLGTDAMKRYGDYAAKPFGERLADLGQPYSPGTARTPQPFALGPQAAPQAPPMMGNIGGGTATGPGPMSGGGGGYGFGGGAPRMVRLQAPTGEVQDVPADIAGGLIARGARRVS